RAVVAGATLRDATRPLPQGPGERPQISEDRESPAGAGPRLGRFRRRRGGRECPAQPRRRRDEEVTAHRSPAMRTNQPLDPLAGPRRHCLSGASLGLGGLALGALLPRALVAGTTRGALAAPHFRPKAQRVIYLFQSGGPAQQELFDYKPLLNEKNGEQLPE